MNKPLTDIELIRKYHLNELDAKAMQQLEQRALDDPFLADALEGFEEFPVEEADIEDLDSQLVDKINKLKQKERFVPGYKWWPIAASVVILIGFISIYLNQPKENKVININDMPEIANVPQQDSVKDTYNNREITAEEDEKLAIIEESPTVVTRVVKPDNEISTQSLSGTILKESVQRTDTLNLNEVVVVGYGTQRKADITGSVATLSGSAAGVVTPNSENFSQSKKSAVVKVSGKIIDEKGEPLPGVTISNEQLKTAAVTNVKGDFSIETKEGSPLNVSYLGYEEQKVKADKDSLNIVLKEDKNALSEVIVVGYGSSKKIAGPVKGWLDFRKYLKANNKLANGEQGTVIVEFTIEGDGKLSNFKILRSLSKYADSRAIELIKNYLTWQGSSDGASQKFKTTLRFQ